MLLFQDRDMSDCDIEKGDMQNLGKRTATFVIF